MNDALGVCCGQRGRDLIGDGHHLIDRETPHAPKTMIEILALEVFHDQERLAGRQGTEVEHLNDVRVTE